MTIKTIVGISNHHVHLTEEEYFKLFGKRTITFYKSTNQPGQFAGEEKVSIKTEQGIIDNLRVMGPFRSYCQIEITKTDAYKLGIEPPVRKSGDVINGAKGIIVGPIAQVETNNIIIANRHVHIPKDMSIANNINDNQLIKAQINNTSKKGSIDLYTTVADNFYYEVHLDMDDANAFLLKNEDEIELIYDLQD